MKKAAVALLTVLALASAGCSVASKATPPSRPPASPLPMPALVLLAGRPNVGEAPGTAARTVMIVSPDGVVTTRTVPTNADPVLSPDGRSLAFPAPAAETSLGPIAPHGRLRVMDLATGAVRDVVPIGGTFAWGWDAEGRVVALTGTLRSPPGQPGPPLQFEVRVWRGAPGSLKSVRAIVSQAPESIDGVLAADDKTAYFTGTSRGGVGGGAIAYTLWRFDFASRRLRLVTKVYPDGRAIPMGGGFESPLQPFAFGSRPQSAGPTQTRLPRAGYETMTLFSGPGKVIGGRGLRAVDLLDLADLRPAPSIILTPPPVFAEEDRHLIFDPTFSRYLEVLLPAGNRDPQALGGVTHPAVAVRLVQVDVATGLITPVLPKPDPLALPLGYLGSGGAFAFQATDGDHVSLFVQLPGATPRRLLVLGPAENPAAVLGAPTLLGVQHAR